MLSKELTELVGQLTELVGQYDIASVIAALSVIAKGKPQLQRALVVAADVALWSRGNCDDWRDLTDKRKGKRSR